MEVGRTGFDVPLWALVTRSCVRVQSCGGSRSFVAAGAPDRLNARARPGPADSSSRAHGCVTWWRPQAWFLPAAVLRN
jgi:hypothetical protein